MKLNRIAIKCKYILKAPYSIRFGIKEIGKLGKPQLENELKRYVKMWKRKKWNKERNRVLYVTSTNCKPTPLPYGQNLLRGSYIVSSLLLVRVVVPPCRWILWCRNHEIDTSSLFWVLLPLWCRSLIFNRFKHNFFRVVRLKLMCWDRRFGCVIRLWFVLKLRTRWCLTGRGVSSILVLVARWN